MPTAAEVIQKTYNDSQFDVFMDVNLETMFGRSVVSSVAREAIGDSIVATIRDRTAEGIFNVGSNTYSPEYLAANPQKSNPVNLRLTNSMMRELAVIDSSNQTIRIGFTTQANRTKAHGHDSDFSGGPPQREFMYLTDTELREITGEFRDLVGPSLSGAVDNAADGQAGQTLQQAFDFINFLGTFFDG